VTHKGRSDVLPEFDLGGESVTEIPPAAAERTRDDIVQVPSALDGSRSYAVVGRPALALALGALYRLLTVP
jgi:hypothetical protein